MHPRNRHQGRYDLQSLIKTSPDLGKHVFVNEHGTETLDFADAEAVKSLNRALLKSSYGIEFWDIPEKFLCPPIPGRADYIHTISDLVGGKADPKIRVLDIGTGANVIYPLLGHAEYKWNFVGSDVDSEAVKNAELIISKNKLESFIEIRKSSGKIFEGIILSGDQFDLTMCNPPFHASAEEASAGTERKWKNLGKKGKGLNFGGKSNELWTQGGEKVFLTNMIKESALFKTQVRWFTTLVSKDENLKALENSLQNVAAKDVRILRMEQGQKKSRVLAWTYR